MPAALEVNWEEIKQYMMLSGASFEDTARKFSDDQLEVTHWAIRKRAERERWPLPERVAKIVESIVSKRAVQNDSLAVKSAENWAEKGETHRALAFQKAHEALKATPAPEIKDWADMERADKMARRSAGLDTSESTVSNSFNFTMLGERMEVEAPVIEIQAQDVGELPE